MPRYRKLHTQTTQSLDVNDMPDDFTRLLWVMLPLALCREGRGMNNLSWIRSNIFPLRLDVTLEMVGGAMDWYAEHGMIARYAVNGRSYFLIPTFHKYQGNTVKEAESIYPPPYPPPPDDQFPTESIPAPDEVLPESIVNPDEGVTNSTTDSIYNTQYSDSDSESNSEAEAEAVFNSEVSPKTSPPSLSDSSYSQTPENQERLQERFGTDPLSGLAKFAQRQEAKTKGRPAGWGSVSTDVWTVCALVGTQFPCSLPVAWQSYNAATREIALQQIDRWSGGATLLLEKFNGDAGRACDAITTFRRTWDGGFTVAGPQSLLNSVGPGIVSKPALKPWKRGHRRPEYEPASDAERAAAWERYAPALERYIEERGGDTNLDAVMEETASAVGCSIESARALLEARAVRAALAEEPLAIGAEAIEAFFANET